MKGDNPVLLDMSPTETEDVTVTRDEPSTHSWKRTGALLTITLCLAAAAAILFTFYYKHHAVEADDLRHTLRQLSGSGNVRAAIHLDGEYNTTLDILEWKQGVNQYLAEGDLRLDNNEIVIPSPGLYFVYSQASFHVNCYLDDGDSVSAARKMVHVSHAVKRCSASYSNTEECEKYETILHSVRTACEKKESGDPKEKWYGSVYMGAVFKLNMGDRLKTVMDKKFLPLLDDKSGNTFFGVFAL